jgi:hypothetical protein
MGMSYMGIKQHCLTLQRDGYLDTWRRPQRMGRPEMVYRLTSRSHDLFQADSHQFTLDLLKSLQEIYGPNAPEKLLYVFEDRGAQSSESKTMAERAKWLAISVIGRWPSLPMGTVDGLLSVIRRHEFSRSLRDHWAFEQDMFNRPRDAYAPANDSQLGALDCAFYFAV